MKKTITFIAAIIILTILFYPPIVSKAKHLTEHKHSKRDSVELLKRDIKHRIEATQAVITSRSNKIQ